MASRNVQQGTFIRPQSSSSSDESLAGRLGGDRRKRRRRDASVYDAVAGRVTTTLALDDASGSDAPHHRASLRDPTLAPEEVLFRRRGAPVRFAEKDIYHANERLPHGGQDVLPDSDMLKAIHQYASHYYAALASADTTQRRVVGTQKVNIDERSMDETALLAFGILLEEAGREALGKKGDLVFTEGVEANADGEQGEETGEAFGFLGARESR